MWRSPPPGSRNTPDTKKRLRRHVSPPDAWAKRTADGRLAAPLRRPPSSTRPGRPPAAPPPRPPLAKRTKKGSSLTTLPSPAPALLPEPTLWARRRWACLCRRSSSASRPPPPPPPPSPPPPVPPLPPLPPCSASAPRPGASEGCQARRPLTPSPPPPCSCDPLSLGPSAREAEATTAAAAAAGRARCRLAHARPRVSPRGVLQRGALRPRPPRSLDRRPGTPRHGRGLPSATLAPARVQISARSATFPPKGLGCHPRPCQHPRRCQRPPRPQPPTPPPPQERTAKRPPVPAPHSSSCRRPSAPHPHPSQTDLSRGSRRARKPRTPASSRVCVQGRSAPPLRVSSCPATPAPRTAPGWCQLCPTLTAGPRCLPAEACHNPCAADRG
mmetsp:Transcript_24756/g.62983  ORF Transcript_24756/g.62983 Transcript_24756/m.62983 type:complete len:386 (-) Transcript_24756:996-2153(-)